MSARYTRVSAYREIRSSIVAIGSTLMWGEQRIRIASGSIARANRRGDNGHPCLVPLVMEKVSVI